MLAFWQLLAWGFSILLRFSPNRHWVWSQPLFVPTFKVLIQLFWLLENMFKTFCVLGHKSFSIWSIIRHQMSCNLFWDFHIAKWLIPFSKSLLKNYIGVLQKWTLVSYRNELQTEYRKKQEHFKCHSRFTGIWSERNLDHVARVTTVILYWKSIEMLLLCKTKLNLFLFIVESLAGILIELWTLII